MIKQILLATLLAPFVLGFSAPKSGRYVVYTNNTVIQHYVGEYKKHRYSQRLGATIAELSETQAAALVREGFRVEPDVVASLPYPFSRLASGCEEAPKPKPPLPPDPNQPPQVTPWGVTAMGADKVWGITKGQGSIVCIVDTGIDFLHPDLESAVLKGKDFTRSGSYYDGNGHGSHVAGTIAAADDNRGVVGIAPLAKLIANKGLSDEGSGFSSDLAEAIYDCADQGADVINESFGSSVFSKVIHDANAYAKARGVIVVAAAGNESTEVGYPAKDEEAIAISSIGPRYLFSYFSNFGPEVMYTAPGEDILSTIPGGKYAEFQGTSMATPHVAGAYALLISVGKTELKAKKLPGLTEAQQGLGLPDLVESLK